LSNWLILRLVFTAYCFRVEKLRLLFLALINIKFIFACGESDEIAELEKICAQNEVKFISIFHEFIDADFVKKFSNQEIFAWTVNDAERLKELEALGIKYFASDHLPPSSLNM
jgi:hypothetical protein